MDGFSGEEYNLKKLWKMIDRYMPQYLEDLQELIAIPSVRDLESSAEMAPFGDDIAKALECMLSIAGRDGFQTFNADGYIGVISNGLPGPAVGAIGHLDVMPAGEKWNTDPFLLSEDSGYLFGRGVIDDKGPLLAAYYALRILRDSGQMPQCRIEILAGTNEESGMNDIESYKTNHELPVIGFTPDASFPYVYAEKGRTILRLRTDKTGCVERFECFDREPGSVIEKARAFVKTDGSSEEFDEHIFDFFLRSNFLEGSFRKEDDGIWLEIVGRKAHSATCYYGKNAGIYLLNFISHYWHDPLAASLNAVLWDWKGTPERIQAIGSNMGSLTMNPAVIELQDDQWNILVDIRYPHESSLEKILSGFQFACRRFLPEMSVDLISNKNPILADSSTFLGSKLMEAYQEVTGDLQTKPVALSGGTYAKRIPNFAGFGPLKPEKPNEKGYKTGGEHRSNEAASVDTLKNCIAAYMLAFIKLSSAVISNRFSK